jgi:hypothetical protein
MSAQNPTLPTATEARGIDAVLLDFQMVLDFHLDWLENAMGRAYILNKQQSNKVAVFRPFVWQGGANQDYHEPLPDNDKKGSSYFIVKPTSYRNQQFGRLPSKDIDVSIIFTVNLKMIDPVRILTENFTRHLILDVEKVISEKLLGKPYRVEIESMTDVFEEVFRESDIDTLQGKAFGKMNYFRFDTVVKFDPSCPSSALNRCGAILQNISQDDLEFCIVPAYYDFLVNLLCGGFVNQYQFHFDGFQSFKQAPINAAYDFASTDSFTLECWVTPTILNEGHIISKYDLSLFRGYILRGTVTGAIRFDIQHQGGTFGALAITAPGILTVGVKKHIVAVYTGTATVAGMALYVDGVAVPLTPFAPETLVPGQDITNNETLKMGALPSAGRYFNGDIDEVRIRNIALTAPQAALEWNGGTPIAPIAGGLVLYDRMGEGSQFGVTDNWISPDLSGTLGVDKGTETVLIPYSGRVPS